MKERPILFSGAMVRAILSGQKTQTRRVVKMQPRSRADIGSYGTGMPFIRNPDLAGKNLDCPYGQPGDRLWVRESFMPAPIGNGRWNIAYAADGDQVEFAGAPADYNPMLYNYERWTPSIHMPRWACRLVLEIISVRVERLQDISRTDAIAEGIQWDDSMGGYHVDGGRHFHASFATESYRSLWESINGTESWIANPWVWVVEFKRVRT